MRNRVIFLTSTLFLHNFQVVTSVDGENDGEDISTTRIFFTTLCRFVLQDSTLYSFKKEKVSFRMQFLHNRHRTMTFLLKSLISECSVLSSLQAIVFFFLVAHPILEDYTNRTHSFDVYSADFVFSMVASSENEKEGRQSKRPPTNTRNIDWIRAIGRAIVISRTKSWSFCVLYFAWVCATLTYRR